MTDPSVATQKVLAAIESQHGESDVAVAIAALHAVADQVVPLERTFGGGFRQHRSATAERRENRRQILAIVAELKALQ